MPAHPTGKEPTRNAPPRTTASHPVPATAKRRESDDEESMNESHGHFGALLLGTCCLLAACGKGPEDTGAGATAAPRAGSTEGGMPGEFLYDRAGDAYVYGADGRPTRFEPETFRRNELPSLVEQAWNDALALDDVVSSALAAGLARDAVSPARRLLEIHPNPERATVILGIALTQSGETKEAVELFTNYLAKEGDSAYVLTNLAKTHAAMGQNEKAEEVLWRALRVDPNQENGLLWLETMHRERGGVEAQREVLQAVARFEGSWRPQLWIAELLLDEKKLDEALAIYHEMLDLAVANDGLTAISGALASHGYQRAAVDLVAPVYDPGRHDPITGTNLIQAWRELGESAKARAMWQRLDALPKPHPRVPELGWLLERLRE